MLTCAHTQPATACAYNCVHSAPAPAGDPDQRLVMHEPSGIGIRRKRMAGLAPRGWLGAELLDLFMVLYQERDARRRQERAVGAGGQGRMGTAAAMCARLVR